MNLLDLKLLVVIFAPGTGGNHLCNMLSLSDSLHRLCPVDCYVDVLTTKYLNITPELDAAHFKSAMAIHPAAQRPLNSVLK
jgi:hypothetical protein